MKTAINAGISWILLGLLISCNTVKTSRYAAFNEFSYEKDQPNFHFRNDSLHIEGAWHWATFARAIPKVSYLPKIPFRILQPIARQHGPVLFATWQSRQSKYFKEGDVPVKKSDVRYEYKVGDPFYIVVLINTKPFNGDTSKYKAVGRNNDYHFQLYATRPQPTKYNYWTMEVVAASTTAYYNFVCILDISFMNGQERQDYQGELFLEDIKTRFFSQ